MTQEAWLYEGAAEFPAEAGKPGRRRRSGPVLLLALLMLAAAAVALVLMVSPWAHALSSVGGCGGPVGPSGPVHR
jgi:hypothetical protein